MSNRKQIIAITVLGIVALMLGCKPDATEIGEVAGDPVKPKPVRELTAEEKKLVGTYERKSGANTIRLDFLNNGIRKYYFNGERAQNTDLKWSLVENEIHVAVLVFPHEDRGYANIYRINPDNSLNNIAIIGEGGKRKDFPKGQQEALTFKKIK